MGQHEFERLKPQLWAAFAATSLADAKTNTEQACDRADALLNAFERRFVGKDEDA